MTSFKRNQTDIGTLSTKEYNNRDQNHYQNSIFKKFYLKKIRYKLGIKR